MPKDKKQSTVVRWEAQEYITHDKNAGWYIGLTIVAIALIALAIFLKQWIFIAVIVLAFISLILYEVRPPRKIQYAVDGKGLTEGEKVYNISDEYSKKLRNHSHAKKEIFSCCYCLLP